MENPFFSWPWNQTWNQTFLWIFDDPIQPVGFAGISCTSKNQLAALRCAPDGRLPWISGGNEAGASSHISHGWLGDPRNQMGLSENSVANDPMVLLIIIPTKWL